LARGADRAGSGKVPAPVAKHNHPRRQSPIDGCQIVGTPVDLLVIAAKRPAILGTTLVWADQTVAKVGFGVDVDEMGHAIVVRVPEIAKPAGHAARHAPMVDVAGKVRLADRADRRGIFLARSLVGSPTVVTIRFVVTRVHHVCLLRCDDNHLIKERIQDALVDDCSLRRSRGWKIVLDLLLQPVVGICNVSCMDHELIIVNHLGECGNGGLLIDLQRIRRTGSDDGT
jgi:hypothetical protein